MVIIHPDAYKSSLAGTTARIGFTLTHWYIQKRGDKIASNAFSGDIDSIRVHSVRRTHTHPIPAKMPHR